MVTGVRTIERARLLEPLSSGRVVVLVAPGGFGKSTLADQLLKRWQLVPIRIRLQAVTTAVELVEQIRRALVRSGLRDLAASITDTEPSDAIDRFLGAVRERDDQFTLLVDDAQFLSDDASVLFGVLVAELSARCHCVVCGRTLSSEFPALSDYRFAEADDLRMTSPEVGEILAEMATPSLVSDLETATDGWPTAVVVAANRLRTDPAWSPCARSAGSALFAGLIEPMLGSDRASFARLARLPMLDETVGELAGGQGALDRLARSSVPTRTEHGQWTVIPDAVREALVLVGGSDTFLDAATVVAIAGHYAGRGELLAATQLIYDGGDLAMLAEVLAAQHWTQLEGLGLDRLAHLIGLIPEQCLVDHSMLLVRAAQAAEQNRPALRRTWVEMLRLLPVNDPHARLAGDAERARVLVRAVQLDEAIMLGDDVLRRAERSHPGDALSCARALMAIGHANAFTATEAAYDRAERAFERAALLFEAAGEHRWQAEALARLGYNVLFHRGRIVAAGEQLEHALGLLPSGDRTRANWLTSYADVLDWLGEHVLADAAIAEAIEIGERLRDNGTVALAQWTRAWSQGRRGNLAGVREVLVEVERLRPGWLDGASGVEFYGSLSDHLVILGDIDGCRYCERKARELGARFDYPQAVDFMSARIEAVIGDPALALQILERLESSIGEARNTRWVRRLEGALAALRLGEEERARVLVVDAISQVEAMSLPDLPRRHEGALVDLLSAVWPTVDADATRVISTITMLGTFAVRSGQRDITPASGNPSTLLKLLVLRRTMTVDSVIDALWPDVDIDTGRARLRNTMNRLRGKAGACIERRGDSLHLAEAVRSDVDAFERAAAEALAGDSSTRIGLARQAISLYAGELLPGDAFEDWAAAPRERMLRRFVGLIDLVADAAEQDGNYDEAARLLDLGVTADPLDERRYVRLGQVLLAQGRVATARQVAELAVAVLGDLGLCPGPELARLRG